ncbi:hypothetical protein CMUS01_08819 [Colletotrichum musicola]|uniref:NACHT domain-containing protein n=1 Tax=Colletotrichum musicola TaxID=2175873 RepID=A0A8H6KBG4_9PEZI|nr:hypothetical protein CMUS01_08819 [Colletotrichum musicola]
MSFGFGVGDFIAVLQLAKRLRDRYHDAPDHMDSLSREIPSIHSVLEKIDDVQQRLTPYEVAALEAPIQECGKVLAEIQKIYDAGGGTKRLSDAAWKARLKGLRLNSKDVQDLRLRILLNIHVLNTIRTFGDSEAIQAVRGMVDSMYDEQKTRQKREILEWLTATDYEPQHRGHMDARQDGTGQWLLDSDKFKTWMSEKGKGLLCPGDPGSGKTIMTSIVVDELSRQFPDEDVAIAYVFCNAKDQAKQTLHHILSSLAKQLAQAHVLPARLVSAYEEHRDKGTTRSEGETLGLLRELAGARARVFVLVDALDECGADVRQRLLSELSRLQRDVHVNIFATTRQILEIVDHPDLGRCDTLPIQASNDDVLQFVAGQMPRMQPFVQKRPDIQAQIKDVVAKKADGMFLLALFLMDFLRRKQRPKDVLDALRRLPTAYTAYYDEAWERIIGQDPDEAELATKVISWVVCAKQPLGIAELQHALAAEHESQIDEDSIFPEEAITSVCAGLVKLDEQKKIRLVHLTTQEYFVEKRYELFHDVDATIAATCFHYLCLPQVLQFAAGVKEAGKSTGVKKTLEESTEIPFCRYALLHGSGHMDGLYVRTVPRSLKRFLYNPEALGAFRVLLPVVDDGCKRLPEARAHMAALLGFTDVFRDGVLPCEEFVQLEDGPVQGSSSRAEAQLPLYWAVCGRHYNVVKFLLECRAMTKEIKHTKECRPGQPESARHPLQVAFRRAMRKAVEMGSVTMINWFLEFCAREGVHAEVESDGCDALLSIASQRRSDERSAVKALLGLRETCEPWQQATVSRPLSPYGVKIDKLDWRTIQALGEAGCRDIPAVKERLEMDIEARDDRGRTPLLSCAREGDVGGIKALLELGADTGVKDDDGETALLLAVKREGADTDMVRFFLECDGEMPDMEARDDEGKAVLWHSAARENIEILEVLVAHGADPKVRDNAGRTVLWPSVSNGNLEMLKMFLACDVDPEAKDNAGQTILFPAAQEGNPDVVRYLLTDLGMDANARDSGGQTPLEFGTRDAMGTRFGVVLADLVSQKVLLNTLEVLGDEGARFPREFGYLKTIKLLLDALEGDDEVLKRAHQAVLVFAVRTAAVVVVDFLLERGVVDLSCRDEKGMTPLMHAVRHGNCLMTRKLLDLGAEEGIEVERLPTGSKRC